MEDHSGVQARSRTRVKKKLTPFHALLNLQNTELLLLTLSIYHHLPIILQHQRRQCFGWVLQKEPKKS
jgi:hypothetical protein